MTNRSDLRGTFTLPSTSITVNRMGYGAMQLAGRDGDKLVWGPPRDVPGAIAVLREAVASGANHIDTSDFYGPHVTNQLIKQALHPYPDDLVIVTKVGARRGSEGRYQLALKELVATRLEPEDLKKRLNAGENVYIIDLRYPLELLYDPFTLPGAHRLSPDALTSGQFEVPRDRDVVLY